MPGAGAFERDGYAIVPGVLGREECQRIAGNIGQMGAGSREMLVHPWCRELAAQLAASAQLAGLVPPGNRPVQCTFFEKSADTNWLVPVHQDLSIPVAGRVDAGPLRGWSCKDGQWFVQPPVEVLAQLVALRLHLDDCGPEDGPLFLVPGSHAAGIVSQAEAVSARTGEVPCCVPAGGLLAMRPLLLHRSSKATGTSRRRVLHFLYGPAQLPSGLSWPAMNTA